MKRHRVSAYRECVDGVMPHPTRLADCVKQPHGPTARWLVLAPAPPLAGGLRLMLRRW